MRSIFFQHPLQHQIEIDGENWDQGEEIKGKLIIRNMSSETVVVNASQVILAYGLKKSIKEGNESPWEVLEKQVLTKNISLPAGGEQSYEWIFQLATDCPITDKQGGLYLLFGGEDTLSEGGRLDLPVSLHPILQNFLQTFSTQFFSWKNIKNENQNGLRSNLCRLNQRNIQIWTLSAVYSEYLKSNLKRIIFSK